MSPLSLRMRRMATRGIATLLTATCTAAPALAESPAAASPLDSYVADALQSNHALNAQNFAVEASAQSLAGARAAYWPTIGVNARYTIADGGRTIDFPAGDLLNPVYQTLNALTAGSPNPTNFPTVDNQHINLLRSREQDTRLTLTTPLYVPQLAEQVNLRLAQMDSSIDGREVVARMLVRDVKNAYYGLSQAQARIGILEASERTLQENVRVNQSMLDAGKATRDQVLRASAELIGVQQSLLEARNGAVQAKRYLNLLRNKDADAEVVSLSLDSMTAPAAPAASGHQDEKNRAELRQIDNNLRAAQAAENLADASYRPSVVLAADTGYQGEDYRWHDDSSVSTASVVMNWTLWDAGIRKARVGEAQAQKAQLNETRENLRQQLRLAVLSSKDNMLTAAKSVEAARARQEAAEEAFRIATRKRDAGALPQIEFFDAERLLAEARLGVAIAMLQQRTSEAEFEYATASYPLPGNVHKTMHANEVSP